MATIPDHHRGSLDKQFGSDCQRHPSEASSKTAFERYIKPLTINNFGFTLQSGWEGVGLTFQFAWLNGGPAAIVYGALIAGIGSTLVAAALAEMASMYITASYIGEKSAPITKCLLTECYRDPSVGAQYRWSARFAQRAPKFWGFMQGWITVIAWICNCAAAFSVSSNALSGLIIFNNPSYEPKAWHATLLLIVLIIIPVLFNLALRTIVNSLEIIGGIFHILFFIGIVTTLCALATRSTSEFVFKTLHRDSGWDNPGVAFSIGMLSTAYPISSFDGVLHMINETKQPRKQVPRAMLFATSSNAVMQFAFCVCLMFCVGNTEAVSQSLLPVAEVFYSATGSKAASTIMVVMMAGICMISNFNVVASVSRLVWQFARDKGLPYSEHFTSVHPALQVPLPALFLVGTICCLLSLINLGSPTAFNALIALPTIALYISYLVPIILLTMRQLAGNHPQYGPWKLGRLSIPIKVAAAVYLIYVTIFVPFPTSRPVTSLNMNYASPIFLGACLIALVDWFIRGKKRFQVPTAPLCLDDEK